MTSMVWTASHAFATDGMAGSAGTDGANGTSVSGTATISATVTAGSGTDGGNGLVSTSGGNGGAGGFGGAGGVGVMAASGTSITISNTINAGSGGNGGDGAAGGSGNGGAGGDAGAGSAGLLGSNLTITNNADGAIIGGMGGNGGNGGSTSTNYKTGGVGGNGGAGGAGIAVTTATITNSGFIKGGDGGAGGSGGDSGGQPPYPGDPARGGAPGTGGAGIQGSALTITNALTGMIQGGSGGGAGITGSDLNVTNDGVIGNMFAGAGINITGGTNTLTNSLYIVGGDGWHGIVLQGGDTTITNTGTISGGQNGFGYGNANGIDISAGTASIVNLGTIAAGTANDSGIHVSGSGSLVSLSNVQGGIVPALTYSGTLPTNYNIIIQSLTNYGQLAGTNLTGSTHFGIGAGSTLALGTYAGVLQGFTSQNIDPTTLTGREGRFLWTLAEDTDPNTLDTWDLTVVRGGPDAVNTLLALKASAGAVRNALSQRTAGMTNALDYDCRDFGANNICIGFQARYTGFDSMSDGAGVLTAAYRIDTNTRVGAFIDQRAAQGKKTGISYSGDMPTFGAFVGYTQQPNNTGLQAKFVVSGNSGNIAVTRDASLENTEAGSGKSSLNSWAAGAEFGWGMMISNNHIATPYVGLRYTDVTRGAYTEAATDSVTNPISYNSFYQRQTAATAGIRFAGQLTDKIGYSASAGVEYDVGRNANHYSGTSAVYELEAFSFNPNSTANRFRANASAGLSYAIDKNQKITTSASIRNQAYSAQPSLTTMAGYQVSF